MKKTYPPGISKLPDGRWRIRAKATDPRTDRPVEADRILPAGARLSAVVLERAALAAELRQVGAATDRGQTLGAYAPSWLERKLPYLRSDLTRARYAEALDLHVLPALGDFKVSAIDRIVIEEWLTRARDAAEHHRRRPGKAHLKPRSYSAATINGWWRVLKSCLQAAVGDLQLERDPTLGVRPLPLAVSTNAAEDSNTLSDDEVGALLRHCKAERPEWFAFTLLGFAIGARPGELRPLRWKTDLDLDTGRLTLQQSERNGYRGPTKTGVAREFLLPPPVVSALRSHRHWLLDVGHPGANGPLVFPSPGKSWRAWRKRLKPAAPMLPTKEPTGPALYMSASAFDKPLAEMARAVGVKRRITPRAMRRTFNDAARRAGLNNLVTRSVTGHQSETMQQLYSTVAVEEKRGALAKVIALYGDLGAAASDPHRDPHSGPHSATPSGTLCHSKEVPNA